jgi:hypothetical protein
LDWEGRREKWTEWTKKWWTEVDEVDKIEEILDFEF